MDKLKLRNLGKTYTGMDVGANVVVVIETGTVAEVSDAMADYLTESWPEDWEVVEEENPIVSGADHGTEASHSVRRKKPR